MKNTLQEIVRRTCGRGIAEGGGNYLDGGDMLLQGVRLWQFKCEAANDAERRLVA